MKAICLHNKDEIEINLRRNSYLHLYEIGDLDDFFWEHTTWYGLKSDCRVKQIVLIYTGTLLPVLIALAQEPLEPMRELLRRIRHLLPRRIYAHLSGDLADVLRAEYHLHSHGKYYKMALMNSGLLNNIDASEATQLLESDLHDLENLYQVSHPGNWFDSRMLKTGHYYGIRRGGNLVSVAGVHLFSPLYKVAALGNITTHPNWRGKGLATKVTAKLCLELGKMDHIGLNVNAENTSAIACYEKLGFERIASYEECLLELKQ